MFERELERKRGIGRDYHRNRILPPIKGLGPKGLF